MSNAMENREVSPPINNQTGNVGSGINLIDK